LLYNRFFNITSTSVIFIQGYYNTASYWHCVQYNCSSYANIVLLILTCTYTTSAW